MNLPTINTSHTLQIDININAPIKDAWAVLSDFNNVYTWAPSVTHSYGLNHQNQQQGAGRHCDIKGFGSIQEVITEWQPDSGFQFTVTDLGPLTGAISNWQVSATGDNTSKLTVEFGYNLKFGVIGKLIHKLVMRKKLEQGLQTTLVAFKQRVETGNLLRPLTTESQLATN